VLLERFQVAFMEANAQQDADSQMPGARIISPATIPEKPSFPKATLFIAAGFAGSVLIGVLLAFGVEAFDPGFRSGEQVEQQLGVPVISLIPLLGRVRLAGETPEKYMLNKPDSTFAEAVRSIHTTMMLASAEHTLRTIAVCSSEPGEGKTTVAISLAQLQARLGRRVLLVDADFRLPSVAKSLGLRKGPGLMEFMAGTASHADVVQRHLESGADVIVSGDYTEAGYDLIASEKTENLIKRWRETYDLVIIDTAPLHVVSDSRIFSKYADGTFLVVRWGKTRREAVNYSLNMISEAGGRLFGVVLSMVDTKRHATYGFGDSGFYHGKAKKYYRE
jgi:capsular exopolysaccharide synthesis family protein